MQTAQSDYFSAYRQLKLTRDVLPPHCGRSAEDLRRCARDRAPDRRAYSGDEPGDAVGTDRRRNDPADTVRAVMHGIRGAQPRESFEQSMMAIGHADQYAGVLSRQGTSALHPPHIPSLIGVQDIKYLDATGLVRHRSIGDLMRYAALNTGLGTLAKYGNFQPAANFTSLGFGAEDGTRYSDEQLYALALYLYSLKPPPNPNPVDARSHRGEQIFRREGGRRLPHAAVVHQQQTDTCNELPRSGRSAEDSRFPRHFVGNRPHAGDADAARHRFLTRFLRSAVSGSAMVSATAAMQIRSKNGWTPRV